ncbi:MAG: family 10 glycosylhydrolase [Leptolyngbyaceae cyanobacterium MAG.088]|nr:family 10 glycosylhydrolase [Leptolyngbyaceae cyanobacterium MAG.088]
MASKQKETGCGCTSIPISLILILLGVGYWGSRHIDFKNLSSAIANVLPDNIAEALPWPAQETTVASPSVAPVAEPSYPITPTFSTASQPTAVPEPIPGEPAPVSVQPEPVDATPVAADSAPTPWKQKQIRGIYLSRYQVTNNASEQMIRDRVRYYKAQGINTIIHGVWGNGCTMYQSDVMQKTFGMESCPNEFQAPWLDWLIDEAHKQGMEIHAYFEKGIKLDENSPIFDRAIQQRWIVPGVDKTYPSVDHYVLDVENPEMATFFKQVLAEFVTKYPDIDAVQWDDYLGYHDELPGKVDRTAQLTAFVTQLKADMKAANPNVSFDLCHHNPYWGKRYFAADWENWDVDRAFIQVYNDANFDEELPYVEQYGGVSIADNQLHRLQALINNPKVKNILVFPAEGKPEEAAKAVKVTASK